MKDCQRYLNIKRLVIFYWEFKRVLSSAGHPRCDSDSAQDRRTRPRSTKTKRPKVETIEEPCLRFVGLEFVPIPFSLLSVCKGRREGKVIRWSWHKETISNTIVISSMRFCVYTNNSRRLRLYHVVNLFTRTNYRFLQFS